MRRVGWLPLVAMVSACGGDGGSGRGGQLAVVPAGTPAPTPTPTPVATGPTSPCTLRERQDWTASRLREWYLFPETLPAALDPAPYATVNDYVDALTATARGQRRDRYFTYVTSIAEENAYYESGETAGLGARLGLASDAIVVIEAFEGGPALAAGIDRGTRIVGIGTTSSNVRTVSAILAAEGSDGLTQALGPNTAGTARVLRLADGSGTRDVTVAKTSFELTPISSRYGARVIQDGAKQVGYVNLRTFISTADRQLRTAFAGFRAAGITEVIVDFRYNGGGLVSTAELFTNLLGANRTPNDVQGYVAFRPDKASNDEITRFAPQPESIAPTKIAFIGTPGTASASELVINAMIPYLRSNAALIGGNTYGKPVGQIALDNDPCGERLRVVAFATQNADRQGRYFDGLATVVGASCRAADDINFPLGDAREASVAGALTFLRGGSCVPITASASARGVSVAGTRDLLSPERPSTAQREVPGLF